MDCEKFDRVVLDLLYAELDELTSASAKRHTEHCTRCRGILSELRATREVGVLPLVDPPEGLELKILEAERQARKGLPARQRVGRVISLLAGYAMRPQLAMAALLLLLIGSSLVILRGRPGERDSVMVTEQGLPGSEPESLTVPVPERSPAAAEESGAVADGRAEAKAAKSAPVAAAPMPAATAAHEGDKDEDAEFAAGVALYDVGRYVEAQQRMESLATRGGARASEAALYAARATQQTQGCGAAVTQFEQVSARFANTKSGLEGSWQAAECYRTLGEMAQARRSYEALLSTDYEDRARSALARLEDESNTNATASRKAKAAARPAAGAARAADEAAAAPPAAAKPPAKASKPNAAETNSSF